MALVVGMLSGRLPLRSDYAIILTFWSIQRLPTHNYFSMGIYYQLLLWNMVVVAQVLLYEVAYADIKCADFTYLVLTSIYSRNRWDSYPADVKNGFSTKFWVRECVGGIVMVCFMANNAMWCIMVEEGFLWCVFFLSKSPHLPPIDANATDLTPHITRSVDGMTSPQVAHAL